MSEIKVPVSRINTWGFLGSPLVQTNDAAGFLRQVLAEAARFGMDGRTIVVLDGLASIMGFYEPISANSAAYLGGPLTEWRTGTSRSPIHTGRVIEIERLAVRQRALIAFGAAKPGHIVGTAEIIVASGNLLKNETPQAYWELFTWASLDVLTTLTGRTKEQLLEDPQRKDWPLIEDDEVIRPGGRLWTCYSEVATQLRRGAISAEREEALEPRKLLRPVAAQFLEHHEKVLEELKHENLPELATRINKHVAIIKAMYPDLGTVEEEVVRQHDDFKQRLDSDFGSGPDDTQDVGRGIETMLRIAADNGIDMAELAAFTAGQGR